MVKTDVGPRSRRSQAPNPDGSVDEGALAIPGVSALTRTVERVNHNLTTVAVVYTEALWDPEQALLPAALGPGAVSLGTIRQGDRKSTRLNSSHSCASRTQTSALQ